VEEVARPAGMDVGKLTASIEQLRDEIQQLKRMIQQLRAAVEREGKEKEAAFRAELRATVEREERGDQHIP
jgi:prefoldin subunit 5